MMVMGDEARQTQFGNNNAYCQDNEITWFDWTLVEQHADLVRFTSELIAFRKRTRRIRRDAFFTGEVNDRGLADISWHGCALVSPGWDDPDVAGPRLHARRLPEPSTQTSDRHDIHVMMNMDWQDAGLRRPDRRGPALVPGHRHGGRVARRHLRPGSRAALRRRHVPGQRPQHRGAHLQAIAASDRATGRRGRSHMAMRNRQRR